MNTLNQYHTLWVNKMKSRYLHTKKLTVVVLILLIVAHSNAAEIYYVNSAAEVNDLCNNDLCQLNPGDQIIWKNNPNDNSTQEIVFKGEGTAANPIRLVAEDPGGVVFTGKSTMRIEGEHLIVEGFHWYSGIAPRNLVTFEKDTKNSILRHCAFDGIGTDDPCNRSRWVVVNGENNTVENCSFLNKDNYGVMILVEVGNSGSAVEPLNHTLRKNYFFNFIHQQGNNDSEGIRIGSSNHATWDSSTTVTGNYFVKMDGEVEIISNKSSYNKFSRNTFRKCAGSLVCRHGHSARIEENFFLGDDAEKAGGVRISDSDHTVVNNYMEGLRSGGSKWIGGLVIVEGTQEARKNGTGYQHVDNVTIAFNTLVDCDRNIYFRERTNGSAPTNLWFYNNLISTSSGNIIENEETLTDTDGLNFSGNIMYMDPGYSEADILNQDPEMSFLNGLFRPNPAGPAANAAEPVYHEDYDLEGKARPAAEMDVGATEVSGAIGSVTNRPFTDSDVGRNVGSCFLDSNGNSFFCGNGDAFMIEPHEDVYVNEGNPGQNYNTSEKYEVKNEDGWTKEAYLKFNLRSIVESNLRGTLRLKVRSPGEANHSVHLVSDDNWTEIGLAWNNRPLSGPAMETKAVPTDGQWIEFDVTDAILSEINGDGFLTLVIQSDSRNTVGYHSREAGPENSPFLQIDLGRPLPPPSPSPSLTFEGDPIEDSYVNEGDPDQNYSTSDKYEIKTESGWTKEAFLKFKVCTLPGTVTQATLKLKVRSTASANHTVYHPDSDDWTESGITWENRPENKSHLNTQPVPATGQWIEFDVTSIVAAEINNDGIVSFVINSNNNNTVNYHSFDADPDDQPRLVIVTN